MRKFPVTSQNGVEYLVTIEDDNFIADRFVVKVCLSYTSKYFKKKKFRTVSFSGYSGKEWSYEFTCMAEREIKDYEKGIKDRQDAEAAKEMGESNFESWDGKVSSD